MPGYLMGSFGTVCHRNVQLLVKAGNSLLSLIFLSANLSHGFC
jgi:hypothetical protein